jgi:tetratricopeptide (TPR) repeat protein
MVKKVRKTMRFRGLKRDLSLFICLLGAILFFWVGCHTKKPEKSETEESEIAENEHIITSLDDLKKVFSPDIPPQQAVTLTKDIVVNLMLLDTSDKKRKGLNKIAKYLDSIKIPSEYFDNDNNIIDFGQSIMQLVVIAAEIEPDNFDINLQVAFHYFNIGNTINSLSQSEEHRLISAEYKKKGFQAAKKLVERFPEEAKAFHQRAYFAYHIEGDKKKALELFKRCLELNPELEFCQKGYDNMLEELKK